MLVEGQMVCFGYVKKLGIYFVWLYIMVLFVDLYVLILYVGLL